MITLKDTQRAAVRLSLDGLLHKFYRGPKAVERFTTEVRVLRHLEARACPFVPRLLALHPDELHIVTTHCGSQVEHLDPSRTQEIFAQLESYGIRHDDVALRNVTYRQSDGRFCVIDFEFATFLDN